MSPQLDATAPRKAPVTAPDVTPMPMRVAQSSGRSLGRDMPATRENDCYRSPGGLTSASYALPTQASRGASPAVDWFYSVLGSRGVLRFPVRLTVAQGEG